MFVAMRPNPRHRRGLNALYTALSSLTGIESPMLASTASPSTKSARIEASPAKMGWSRRATGLPSPRQMRPEHAPRPVVLFRPQDDRRVIAGDREQPLGLVWRQFRLGLRPAEPQVRLDV